MTENITRRLFSELIELIDRKEVFAIKGPRQAGKTTLLKMVQTWLLEEKKIKQENIIFLTFEDDEILNKFSTDPKEYIEKILIGKTDRVYIFIDEFQHLEGGGKTLKLLFDILDDVKFIITGSSSLELTNKTAKHMVGRMFSFNLWPLSFREFLQTKPSEFLSAYKEKSELIEKFILHGKTSIEEIIEENDIFVKDLKKYFKEYAFWGGYPEVVRTDEFKAKKFILKNIYSNYIKKDVVELLKITDHSKFEKLIELLSYQIGDLVNIDNLTRDIHGYFDETKRYLSIMKETYITSLLKPYYTNKASEIKKSPKSFFIEIGLRNYIAGEILKLDSPIIDLGKQPGPMVENSIFSQLKFKQEDNYKLRYWRTKHGAEVDFVLDFGKEVVPIEVKYANFKDAKFSRSFKSFIDEYKPERALILTKDFWGKREVNGTKILFAPCGYF